MTWKQNIALRGVAEVALGRQRSPEHANGPFMVKYLRAANVKDGYLDLSDVMSMNFTPEEQRIFGLRPGDVLVTEGSGSLSSVGASAVWRGAAEQTVCFQNTLLRMRPRAGIADGRYLGWWARSAFGSGLFASLAGGANIYHLSAERVRAIRTDLPPVDEQRRIADFLDIETQLIERIMIARQRQMDMIKERQLVRTYEALRGGDGFRGARHPSGIPWLNETPAGWSISTVSRQFDIQLGKMLDQERSTGNYLRKYLRNANVQWDSFDVSDLSTMDILPGELLRYRVEPNDLLICEGGEPGRSAIWDGSVPEIYYQKALHRARPRGYSSVRWLYYCLRAATYRNAFAVQGNATTIAHLTNEQLRSQRFPFPERSTQDRLTSALDNQCDRARRVIEIGRSQINLLAERRQALITAAVTGQIDVTTARGVDVS